MHPRNLTERISPLSVFTLLVYMFLYLPIAVLVILSFNSSRFSTIWQGFTWHWYVLAWQDRELITALRNSLLVALATTGISVLIGTAAGIALARYSPALRRFAEGLVVLPVIVPEIVIGFATAAMFGLLGVTFGISTIVAAHVAFSIPYLVFLVRARVLALDPTLEEAAMDLGATRWQSFTRVTLPMVLPAIISGALLVFTISLDDYVITSFVAGPGSTTLPLKIYSMVKTGVTPQINAISTVLLVATILLVSVSHRAASGKLSRSSIGAIVVGLGLLSAFGLGGVDLRQRGGELNLAIWSNYLPDDIIKEFERRYEARVNVELYDSNEALLAKLQAGGALYDVIVPSDYMVTILREGELLAELERDALSNFSNLDPRFLGLGHDLTNRYSIPYMWGTTGIAYRKDRVRRDVNSWAALWDSELSGRIVMLDDVREAFAAALRLGAASPNSVEPLQLEQAASLLLKQKPLLKAYDSGAFDQLLMSGEAWIVQAYSGQIARVMHENPNIEYVVPKEGATLFIDNLCIPRRAANKDLAHRFIDYVLEAETAAMIANGTGFSSANLAARRWIRPELLTNPAAFPPDEVLDRCEIITDVGESIELYDRFWTRIKSQ